MPKANFWMAATICLLAGTVFGLLAAPATHGIIIGSNSGNTENYNVRRVRKEEEEKK